MKKKVFKMTKAELESLYAAAQTPGVFLGGPLAGYNPARERSEEIWKSLGDKYGFKWETVAPAGRDQQIFLAEPSDPESGVDGTRCTSACGWCGRCS